MKPVHCNIWLASFAALSMLSCSPPKPAQETVRVKYITNPCTPIHSLDKMQVVYVGVDNPLSVSIPYVSSKDVKATATGCGAHLDSLGAGRYNLTVTEPGQLELSVAGGDAPTAKYYLRSKRIPDPVALLGARHSGGEMGSAEFKAMGGVAAMLGDFDFEARCDLVGFTMTRISKTGESATVANTGARYKPEASEQVLKAEAGDHYIYYNISCRCPGDPIATARQLGSLAFVIK